MTRAILLGLASALLVYIYPLLGGTVSETDIQKKQVLEVEREFSDMAGEKGVREAFLHFADDNAVILRNNRLYHGRDGIGEYFDSSTLRDIDLKWEPDFIEVSSSGDLAYTYGKYTFSATDTTGEKIRSQGIFHTVWKKQSDGKWKFVWD